MEARNQFLKNGAIPKSLMSKVIKFMYYEKHSYFIVLFILIANSRETSLTKEEKAQLTDMLVPVLQKCINNFDGSYIAETTIEKADQESDTKFTISGTVYDYKESGHLCCLK